MSNTDLERLLNEPIYAFDFQFMIGDIADFLVFSENNIEWQYQRELQSIKRQAESDEFPISYREHLEKKQSIVSKLVYRYAFDMAQ